MNIVSVKILVKNAEGKVLLQMRDGQTENNAYPLMWGLWGGGVEESDESPLFAAQRELAEELGLQATEGELKLMSESEIKDDKWEHIYVYTKALEWGQFVVNEGAGAGFFTNAEIQQLPAARSISRLLALNVI